MKKRRLYIVGAGSFGRELESWLELISEDERDWEIAGFLDSVQGKGKLSFPSKYQIVGDEKSFPLTKDDYVVISIANPVIRENIYSELKDKVSFYTYISPKAIVGKYNNIGEGSIICPNCIITTNVQLGKCTIVNIGTQIGHDVIIGNFCSLMTNIDIAGKCSLGERVFMGTNSTIIPGKRIADDIKIGAGCIVIRNYSKKGITIYGNPSGKL